MDDQAALERELLAKDTAFLNAVLNHDVDWLSASYRVIFSRYFRMAESQIKQPN